MAANANLHVSPSVINAFADAQNGQYRWLWITIEGESLELKQSGNPTADAKKDFDGLSTLIDERTAAFFVFCDNIAPGSCRWTLIAYVPENAKVREKMLYSSSREDLKRTLGLGFFTGEYNCTSQGELNYDSWRKSLLTPDTDPFSEREVLYKQAVTLEAKERTQEKSNAMGVVPFSFSDDLNHSIKDFSATKIQWVEATVNPANETVELKHTTTWNDIDQAAHNLSNNSPSFIAAFRRNASGGSDSRVFIYFCPDEAPVRSKMLYSTAKQTVIKGFERAGVSFDETTESRTLEEVKDALSTQQDVASLSGQLESTQFSKPTRPGRSGKKTLKKFDAPN